MMTLNEQDFTTLEKTKEIIQGLQRQFQNGNGVAGFWLSIIYSEGSTLLPHEFRASVGVSDRRAMGYTIESFQLLKREAEAGKAESMHLVASYYQTGMPPVSKDLGLFKYWTERAAEVGFDCAEDLLAIYGNPKSQFYDAVKARQLRRQLFG